MNFFRYIPSTDRSVFRGVTKDWFCFSCHSKKDILDDKPLISCKECWRSYHRNCTKNSIKTEENFICNYCIKSIDCPTNRLPVNRLQKLIDLLWKSVENYSKVNFFTYFAINTEPEIKVLVFIPSIDIISVHIRVKSNYYKSLDEFIRDFKHFVHNYCISNLKDSKDYKLVQQINKRFDHEIKELKLCVDCYEKSCERDEYDLWFTQICNNRHELVFVRDWPSKVLSTSGHYYSIRYFSSGFERNMRIHKNFIKPMDTIISNKFKANKHFKASLELGLKYLINLRQISAEKDLIYDKAIKTFEMYLSPKQTVRLIFSFELKTLF